LTTEERPPVVLKITKPHRDVDRTNIDTPQACALEQFEQRLWRAIRESSAFIEIKSGGIERPSGVLEVPHHFHLLRIVPDVSSYDTPGTDGAGHLGGSLRGVGDEVENQTSHGDVDARRFDG
jgi:hypothetical protein